MATNLRRKLGQRQELWILLPVSLLLLVALSIFALFSYRNTVELLIEERRSEAVRLARRLANELSLAPVPDGEELGRRLPIARAVAVLDDRGRQVTAFGTRAVAAPPPPRPWLGGTRQDLGEDLVSGTARYRKDRRSFTVQVDLPAPILRSRERGLKVLTPVVLVIDAALTLLVLVFLRHFLAPFEGLVQRARAAGQEVPETEDEMDFLVATFERALEALAGRDAAEFDELEALQKTLARSLESGVLLCDAEGVVLALNEVGAALLAAPPSAVGRPLGTVLEPHPELVAILDRSIRRGREVKRQECAIDTPEGERILGLTAHPLRRDDGAVRGFLVLFADLTDAQRQRLEIRLADSLSQLGELTAGVAHELRNSLATLRGYLTLVERAPDEESIADYLAEIRRESDHLERVLEDFLTFARPGSARPQPVDLLALTHRAAADPALDGAAVVVRGIEVGVEGSEGLRVEEAGVRGFEVEGDPQLLERAVRNLLMNAVEAQSQQPGAASGEPTSGDPTSGDPVRVRLRRRGGGVEIRIDDRGPGLTPEAEERLFDPFFSQRSGGVGMGLALTRRIALLHGGRVTVENRETATRGARATLWIPDDPRNGGTSDTIGNSRGEGPTAAGSVTGL